VSSDNSDLLKQLVELQVQQNNKLDRIAALLLSQQLLQECVDPLGKPREPDVAGEIVSESFSAGLCLLGELENRNKQYLYQMQEFFIEDEKPTNLGDEGLANPF
tara:strand:+ start:763 stop:1074 length:312 start_codon:yes stop_codon:yes gene_type:complete